LLAVPHGFLNDLVHQIGMVDHRAKQGINGRMVGRCEPAVEFAA
jgi:hypothetical protein